MKVARGSLAFRISVGRFVPVIYLCTLDGIKSYSTTNISQLMDTVSSHRVGCSFGLLMSFLAEGKDGSFIWNIRQFKGYYPSRSEWRQWENDEAR